jgi:hypothetical protein
MHSSGRPGEGSSGDAHRPHQRAWGFTAHRVLMLVCERCSYILTFYEGNTIFDFD